MSIIHRDATPEDRDFIISGWSASFRTSYAAGLIDMDHWSELMHPQLARYLDRDDVRTIVAVGTKRKSSLVYGFIVADTTPQQELVDNRETREWPALVYYVYVKAAYRKMGIARGLFEAVGIDPRSRFLYACKTPVVAHVASKLPLAKYNPLVARFPKASPSTVPGITVTRKENDHEREPRHEDIPSGVASELDEEAEAPDR